MILIIHSADQEYLLLVLSNAEKKYRKIKCKAKYRQSELILSKLDELLMRGHKKLNDIKGIAVVSGPGPFSSLRIGIATANSIGWSLRIPVVGVKKMDFQNINELVSLSLKKLKRAKYDRIIVPTYGMDPNITIKH